MKSVSPASSRSHTSGEEEVDTEMMSAAMRRLRVMIVEDDKFTQAALTESVTAAAKAMLPHARVDVEVSDTAAGALAASSLAQQKSESFDLVLLDYRLPGGCNADDVLPSLRTIFGGMPVVVMLSAAEMVTPMKQCLTLGADAFRVKPVDMQGIQELIEYTMRKRTFVEGQRSRSPSPAASPKFKLLDGAEHLVAQGRRGKVHIGMYHRGGALVIVKEMVVSRGPPPPRHPHVNRVYDRVVDGGACFELRQLCDKGEFFDLMIEKPHGFEPGAALRAFVQIAAAVGHCHAHGAVHGQLHPENVLLRSSAAQGQPAADVTLQLTGFYTLAPDAAAELRPFHRCDAPELEGLQSADAPTLRAADVWALGMLLVSLLSGTARRGGVQQPLEALQQQQGRSSGGGSADASPPSSDGGSPVP